MTKTRLFFFIAFALAAAAGCIRLGFWQISRLRQRREHNALVRSRLDSTEVAFGALPSDTSVAKFRRVRVVGTPDYDHELIWAARSHRGSPGVNFLTPVKVAGSDTAILVDRGWVYAADGATVDEQRWRENDTAFVGWVETFPYTAGATYTNKPAVISHLAHDVVAKALPYPVANAYVIVTGDSTMAEDRIARLTVPPLDEGPHLSYAIQWFAFAAVALVGAGFVVKRGVAAGGDGAEAG